MTFDWHKVRDAILDDPVCRRDPLIQAFMHVFEHDRTDIEAALALLVKTLVHLHKFDIDERVRMLQNAPPAPIVIVDGDGSITRRLTPSA